MLLENQPYPADVRVRSEAEALARLGHRVKVIAPRADGEAARHTLHGVAVSRYRLPRERPGPLGMLAEYVAANLQLHVRTVLELVRGVDVLHIHNPPDTLFLLAWFARLRGARVVFDHHDLTPELFSVKFGGRPRIALRTLHALERMTFRSASHVLAANESHRAVAIERGGVDPGSVTVVRNGPAAVTLHGNDTRPGQLDDPRLMFVGSMAIQDGVLELADIVLELEQRHGLRATLTVVGDGPVRPEVEARCRRAGLSDRVRFTGRVAPERVPSLLAQADVCLDPAPCNALNHRSTMVKIAEYMAAGRPVVAYSLHETERTTEGDALLAPCGDRAAFVDCVARLSRDEDLRSDLSRRGLARAAQLTWQHSERALVSAYARL